MLPAIDTCVSTYALTNKGILTILFGVEEMDFLIYTFVYNTKQDYSGRVLHHC